MRRVRIAHYQVVARNDMQLCTGKQKEAIYLIRSIKLSAIQKPRGFTLSMELLCSFTILGGNHSRRLSYADKHFLDISHHHELWLLHLWNAKKYVCLLKSLWLSFVTSEIWKYTLLLCLLFCSFPCCETYHAQLSDHYAKKLPIFSSPAISDWLQLVLKPVRIVLSK